MCRIKNVPRDQRVVALIIGCLAHAYVYARLHTFYVLLTSPWSFVQFNRFSMYVAPYYHVDALKLKISKLIMHEPMYSVWNV